MLHHHREHHSGTPNKVLARWAGQVTPLACPGLSPLTFRLSHAWTRNAKARSVFLALQRDGRCLGSDATQTLHKRANRSTRHASWHQREIVPVRYVMVVCCGVLWCAHYYVHPAVFRCSWHSCCYLRHLFPLPTARHVASRARRGASLNSSRDSRVCAARHLRTTFNPDSPLMRCPPPPLQAV